MNLNTISAQTEARGLSILGAFHPGPGDHLAQHIRTLVLLGPNRRNFWPDFKSSPEFQDRQPDPLDRWSARVISVLAEGLGATPYFPFGGASPFISWALRSGSAWSSPVKLLVHHEQGLFLSFRGALGLNEALALPPAPSSPCPSCPKPCLTACPATALTGDGYDLAACHAYLDTGPGAECMTGGCQVRRACPIGQEGMVPERNAFHMAAFHGTQTP